MQNSLHLHFFHHSSLMMMSTSSTTTTLFLLFSLSYLLHSTTTSTATLPSDIAALKAIKSSINPTSIPSYSCLASWDFTSDPCDNPHVTHFLCGLSCSGNRITQLTFDPAGYAGTLSPLISKLTQLVTIDLSANKLSGPIPDSIFFLPNLQTLVLQSNSFSGNIPPSISNLKSIQTLDFAYNSLTGTIPNTLSQLNQLTRLDLSFNKLAGPIPKLPVNLLELAIKANSLSGYLPQPSFNGLTHLEVVELSENSLTGTVSGWFFLLPSLQQIDLANNDFTSLDVPKPINSNLIAVNLGFNKIQGYVPVNFSAYPMLSALTLSYNKLRGPIPWEYSQKPTLRRLFLDGNYLNGLPPKGFFSGKTTVYGSLGDNCLKSCPVSSELCLKSQKPSSICQQAYRGKVKPKS